MGKAQQPKDPSRGPEAILGKGVDVVIGGQRRRIGRLGTDALFELAAIMDTVDMRGEVATKIREKSFADNPLGETQKLLWKVMVTAPAVREQVVAFCARALGVTEEEFLDPEKFPMDAIPAVVEGLFHHMDVVAFFTVIQRLSPQFVLLVMASKGVAPPTEAEENGKILTESPAS